MEIFVIPAELKSFIDSYDKINYQLWNDEGNKDVKKFRSLIRNHGEFKHEVRQFEKSYDNQQAEQISLMV